VGRAARDESEARVSQFPEMTKVLSPAKIGGAEILHVKVSRLESMFSSRNGSLYYCPEGTYCRLTVNGALVMSDTRMERISNYECVRRANGKVLVAGLGIGMVLHPILAKDEVSEVTVIEQSQDVISLVSPSLPSRKVVIIQADIFKWKPRKGTKYDAIYFDIWSDVCTDNLAEIAKLHHAFKSCINRANPRAWMGSWMQEHLRDRQRRGL